MPIIRLSLLMLSHVEQTGWIGQTSWADWTAQPGWADWARRVMNREFQASLRRLRSKRREVRKIIRSLVCLGRSLEERGFPIQHVQVEWVRESLLAFYLEQHTLSDDIAILECLLTDAMSL